MSESYDLNRNHSDQARQMILTGSGIQKGVVDGSITIDPFEPRQLNPNSYNYRLSERLRESTHDGLSAGADWQEIEMPQDGFLLKPNRVYLGATIEKIGSQRWVTTLIGRSSVGRLGMFLTASADLGNLGTAHCWTLEITVVQPLKIYPGMKVGQVCFWAPEGNAQSYGGAYTDFNCPTPAIPTHVQREKMSSP